MLNPLAPDLVRYHVTKKGDKLISIFSTSWLLGTSLLTVGLTGSVFVLEPLYTLWTRGVLPLDRLLFAFLGTAVAVRQWAAPFQTYLASMNRLRSQSAMAGVRAILGLGLAALLLPHLGLPAAGLGALAAEAGAALVAVAAVNPTLRALGTSFPLKPAIYSLLQIGAAAMVWFIFATGAHGLLLWAVAGLLLIVLLTWRQWQALPEQVQTRLVGLFCRPTPT